MTIKAKLLIYGADSCSKTAWEKALAQIRDLPDVVIEKAVGQQGFKDQHQAVITGSPESEAAAGELLWGNFGPGYQFKGEFTIQHLPQSGSPEV